MFSEELRERAEELIGRYPVGRSALLPLLHLVQAQDGMISEDGVAECAELLGLTKAEVMAVATFYSMYKRAALGRHLVSVCTNFSCKVRGAQEVYDRLAAKLGVGHNETTQDGAITLEHAECLGNCEGAPVVTVDYLNYERLTPEAAEQLVDAVVAGSAPPPTRGFTPPGVREIEYRLAGLGAVAAQPSAAEKAEAGAARDDTQPEFARSETLAAEEQAPEELAPASGSGQHGYPGPRPDADDEPGAGDEPAAADAQPDAEDDGGASEEDQDG